MFSSIARPSSVLPAGPSWSTLTAEPPTPVPAGMSPVFTESARPPAYWLTLSESTPTVTPAPLTPKVDAAASAPRACWASLLAVPMKDTEGL